MDSLETRLNLINTSHQTSTSTTTVSASPLSLTPNCPYRCLNRSPGGCTLTFAQHVIAARVTLRRLAMDTELEHIQQGALLRRRKPGNSDVENEEQRDGQLRSVHDGAADDKESSCDDSSDNIARRWTTLAHLPSFRNWTDEYMGASVCIVAIVVLSVVLYHYDGKLAPHLSPALDLDMLVIALMTIVRVALGNIVEACICQCAWVWVSKNHQIRANTQARLEDFKLFDEASRGL